jgi:cell division protein FtsZ
MNDDMFDLPSVESSIIKVIGVGGGGSNAVNYMYRKGIKDVNFVVCNTDSQSLQRSPISIKIQIGRTLTQGLGAGNQPNVGRDSAIESIEDIKELLADGTKMVFVTAGMGGGTGTGAAPIIAKAARELGILTVGIVTIPFLFEGRVRISQAIEGIAEMEKYVDSLLVINNEKLHDMYGDLGISVAFSKADDVLATAAKGIAEIITKPGYINVDFADVETVMRNSGVAVMGSAEGEGEERAIDAIQAALTSPLLNSNNIRGAQNILLNITSGTDKEIKTSELKHVTDYVKSIVGDTATIIWGSVFDEDLGDKVNVTIVATGFQTESFLHSVVDRQPKITRVTIEEDGSLVEENTDTSDDDEERSREVSFDAIDEHKNKMIEMLYAPSKTVQHEEEIYDKGFKPGRVGAPHQALSGIALEDFYDNELLLTQMENIPAYKRRQMASQNEETQPRQQQKNVSRFSISSKGKGDMTIGPNTFLHDNVD